MGAQPPSPSDRPQETDILVPFEIQNIPAEYRRYYAMKRNNLFASIQQVPDLWNCYHMLDQIWFREFEDLNTTTNPGRMFPLLLYFNAHAKIHVALELAFSGCLAEARSILRDGIEFVAHAHAMCIDTHSRKYGLKRTTAERPWKHSKTLSSGTRKLVCSVVSQNFIRHGANFLKLVLTQTPAQSPTASSTSLRINILSSGSSTRAPNRSYGY